MPGTTALIMAAGQGTRMRSDLPKVMHEVCGRPMVAWPVLAAREAGADRVAVIVSPDRDLSPALPEGTETVIQEEADGTGGALRAALGVIRESDTVIVLSGDTPLLDAPTIAAMLEAHRGAGAAATVMTTELDDPAQFGRVVRDADGNVARIAEAKGGEGDATPGELGIKEVNAGTYAFSAPELAAALEGISNDNAQTEYYLPDVLPAIRDSGGTVLGHLVGDPAVNLGVNDRVDLARVTAEARRRLLTGHMQAGVTIVDPDTVWIDADVEIEPDVTLQPGTTLRGATKVATGAVLGPMTTVIDSEIGPRVTAPHSYLLGCRIAAGATIGPFAYLRPDADLGPDSKAGAFTEIKGSRIGAGAKVPHLSYVGDAEVGEGANLGAGTITANYDGRRKHRTRIGKDARVGVNTSLVAPVEVGDGAYTGAGSVVTGDVPEGALGISRPEQRNIEGFAERVEERAEGGSGAGGPGQGEGQN